MRVSASAVVKYFESDSKWRKWELMRKANQTFPLYTPLLPLLPHADVIDGLVGDEKIKGEFAPQGFGAPPRSVIYGLVEDEKIKGDFAPQGFGAPPRSVIVVFQRVQALREDPTAEARPDWTTPRGFAKASTSFEPAHTALLPYACRSQ
jgi:hypothetical protein